LRSLRVEDGVDLAHHGGADRHDTEPGARPGRGLEPDADAFVLGEECIDAPDPDPVDGPEGSREVQRAYDPTLEGCVEAVVVSRREVERGEGAALEDLGFTVVAEQGAEAVGAALDLQDASLVDLAGGSPGSIAG
jgi:hypothetical protein